MSLKIDVKQDLQALASALKDVIKAGAAFHGLNEIDLEPLSFADLTPDQQKSAPNTAADLAELKSELSKAQGHSVNWVNEVAPQVTILPQAFINVGTFVNTWEPRTSSLDKNEMIDVLRSTSDRIGAEAKKLTDLAAVVQPLQQKLSVDAGNFSQSHAAFAELEKLDEANLTATRNALEKIKALIKQESEEIDVDLLNAEQKIDIAIEVMKAGKEAEGEGSEWIKIAVAIVGVVLIAIAEKEIDQALALIAERLKNAEKEEEYQINFNQLTYQLLALEAANVTLASLNSDVADVYRVFSTAAQWFRERQSDLNAIIDAGSPSDQVNDVALKAYAKAWQTLQTAGRNWQYIEVAKPVTNEVSLAGFGKGPNSASAGRKS